MDDTYDSYVTFEELQLLTNAIQRWDVDCMDQLPNFMKLFYKPLLDLYKKVEEKMTEQGQSYRVQYSINQFKKLSESYFTEVKWYRDNYVPTMEEYMRVGVITSGTIGLNVTSLVRMNDVLTPEIFNWASSNPKIMVACAIHARLYDDITSHKHPPWRFPNTMMHCDLTPKHNIDKVRQEKHSKVCFSTTNSQTRMMKKLSLISHKFCLLWSDPMVVVYIQERDGAFTEFKELSGSYFTEVKWYRDNYVPTMEEYMRVGIITGGTTGLNVIALVGMNDALTLEIFNWASNNLKIMVACAIHARLYDDIVSHKETGHLVSAIECYMREHKVSEEEACNVLKKQVDDTWKVINHEMIFSETSKVVPMAVLTRVLNITRGCEFMCTAGDGYTHVEKTTKDGINSLLIDPISVSTSEN
ncbi:hypothetical protein V6N11_020871 [Hibiscus sabdariffa]|uniref:Terpene synthase metal-binding domain-containing protein n=1 Tax=Hibiscus sabdariffa TaxID=183260 RepID=A0ABR2Q9P3_9ROSI